FDSDNDGLYNSWEILQGIDVNGDGAIDANDVPLPGANPVHQDTYAEVDAMALRAPVALPGVTGATNTAPIVITTSGNNGLATGTRVTVAGVGGDTAANGTFTVTRITSSTFSLDGSNGTASGLYTPNTGSWSLPSVTAAGL